MYRSGSAVAGIVIGVLAFVGIMVAVVRKGAVAGDESFVVVYCALPDAVDVHCAVSGRRSLSPAATEF